MKGSVLNMTCKNCKFGQRFYIFEGSYHDRAVRACELLSRPAPVQTDPDKEIECNNYAPEQRGYEVHDL